METKCEIDIGGKKMEFSTGKLAKQANSVLVKYAGTQSNLFRSSSSKNGDQRNAAVIINQ